MALYGLIGLIVAAAAPHGIIAILGSRADGQWDALVIPAWIADGVLAAITALYLLATVAAWGLYRRRRADLDAAGAEAIVSCTPASPTFAATSLTDAGPAT